MNGIYSYRFIPLSRYCIKLIALYYWYLRNTKHLTDNEICNYPIVCATNKQGNHILTEHCKPKNLRDSVKPYLTEIGLKQNICHIPPSKVYETAYQDKALDINVGLLRLNYQYKAKYVCLLTADEIDCLLGRKPKNVDSRHYRDFRELYNQRAFKIKTDRWVVNKESTTPKPNILIAGDVEQNTVSEKKTIFVAPSSNANCSQVVLKISAKPGQSISLKLCGHFGMTGTIITKADQSIIAA